MAHLYECHFNLASLQRARFDAARFRNVYSGSSSTTAPSPLRWADRLAPHKSWTRWGAARLQGARRCEKTDAAGDNGGARGHDWLYVISGRLRLLLGEDNYLLDPGEAAEFTTWTPHWFGAVDGPADFILVVGPHGERTHLEHQSRHSPGPSEQ